MQFKAKSRYEVEKANGEKERHTIISIHGAVEQAGKPAPIANSTTQATLYLRFDDLDFVPMPGNAMWSVMGGEFELFSEADAAAVVSILRATSPEVVVCHCATGQSRSAGLAAALSKYYNRDDSHFFNGGYTPNMHVYRKMYDYLIEELP